MRTPKGFTPADFGSDPWIIEIRGTDSEQAGFHETILALSNGHLGSRGSLEQGDPRHQPGVLVNGFHETWSIDYPEAAYGYAKTGQTILYAPDTTGLKVVVDGRPLDLASAEVIRKLDMRQGLVSTTAIWPEITVRWSRLVSLSRRHLLAMRAEVDGRRGGRIGFESGRIGFESGRIRFESGWRNRQDTDYLSVVEKESDPRRARSFGRRVLHAGPVKVEGASVAVVFRTARSGMDLALAVDHGRRSHKHRSDFDLDRRVRLHPRRIPDREESGLRSYLEPRPRPKPN